MTEITHEHRWSLWRVQPEPGRDGILREGRYCLEWMCDAAGVRPASVAVEAAAVALFEWDTAETSLTWSDALGLTQDRYRREARLVLDAAAKASDVVRSAAASAPE
jgi:hypothetical protein